MEIATILLVLFALNFSYANKFCKPVVSTKYGEILGTYNASRYGRQFMSFRGIPYAQPPVGNLRFKEPQPALPWSDRLDARQDGPICIQKNFFFYRNPPIEGQEDCLYLNVYTPKMDVEELLPVMVFIHWGGFTAGRGTSDYLGPEYFMDEDVILVTFNYRLGVFGFLSTLDDEAPGNYALKDQVAALKWVQENIENFGGDQNQVTIFGQSAGAGSVHYHMLSPMSKGLFHQAISESGSALALWAKPLNDIQKQVTQVQATLVGCDNNIDNARLMECLRNVPAEDLMNSANTFKIIGMDPVSVFGSVIEKQSERNPYPFLTKQPLEYIQDGEFENVPWIIGTVEDEGILRVASLVRQHDQLEEFNKNYSSLFPQMLVLAVSVVNVETELKNITDFFLQGNSHVDKNKPESIQGLIDIYTDRSFVYGSYQSAMLHSALGHKPIWFYNFRYRGEHTYGDHFAGTNETVDFDWGVSHCDDLLYLFRSPGLFPDTTNPTSSTMIDIMVGMWTNFAKNGNPLHSNILQWEPLDVDSLEEMKNENFKYLAISGNSNSNFINMGMETGFYPKRMKFWTRQELFENFDGLN